MRKNKSLFFSVLLILLFQIKGMAFNIPDISNLGKDPEIIKIEPDYLIPGQNIKIIGKNFFSKPKYANKLFINNYPCRINSSNSDLIIFTVPNISLKKDIKIKLFTEYLGYKSKESIFPKDSFLKLTFNSPVITGPYDISVKPSQELTFSGNFNKNYDLFFIINNTEIKADILSNHSCKIKLPENLEEGQFEIYSFYRKNYLDSTLSKKITLFNTLSGKPLFIILKVVKNIFDVFNERSLYKVIVYFENGKEKDITRFSEVKSSDENILKVINSENAIESVSNGKANLNAIYFWKPTKESLDYSLNITIQTPTAPLFNQVIIDEVFPFVSGFIKETDANMDGFPKVNDDEFIELKNLNDQRFDLSECRFFINEADKPVFKFEENSFINALSRLVIFSSEKSKLNLSNSGAVIDFRCGEKTIDYVAYSGGKSGDPSWQRKDDLSGFIKHPGKLFSPGEAPPVLPKPTVVTSPVSLPIQTPHLGDSPSATLTPMPTSSPVPTPHLGDSPSATLTPMPTSSPVPTPHLGATPSPINILITDNVTPINEIVGLSIIPDILIITDRSDKQIQVFAEYADGTKIDITQEAAYKISGTNGLIAIDKGLIKPLRNGSLTLEISYQDKLIELPVTINIKSTVTPKQLIINEVLAAPTLDTNNDGIFKSDQDEFIEIVNVTPNPLDISDLNVSDNTRIRHTFAPNTILQGLESVVIFGGGNNSNFSSNLKSQLADNKSLGINNTGQEQITISNHDGLIIDQIIFDNANLQGVSQNRIGDLNFTSFIAHDKLLKSTSKYSPGIRIDGGRFSEPPQEGSDQIKSSSSSGI